MNALRVMFDTNMVSAIIRGEAYGSPLESRLVSSGRTTCVSIVTACEVEFGLAKIPSRRVSENWARFQELVTTVPFEDPAQYHYGHIRAHLAAQGRPIGANDLFIAAHALALDLVLVTANVGEFSRVPDLRVENWLV